jgi:gluconolactonase
MRSAPDDVSGDVEDQVRQIADGLQFPEGPVAMNDGSVVLVEIRRGTLTRVLPDGRKEIVAELGGGPNGAAVGPDNAVYVCNNGGAWTWQPGELHLPGGPVVDYQGGSIQRVDLATGRYTTLYDSCDGKPLNSPNDIVFDSAGGFWFTALGLLRWREPSTRGRVLRTPRRVGDRPLARR